MKLFGKHLSARQLIVGIAALLFVIVLFWQLYLLASPKARISFDIYTPKGYAYEKVEEVLYTTDIIPGVRNIFTPKVSVRYELPESKISVSLQKTAKASYHCDKYDSYVNDIVTCGTKTTPDGRKYQFLTVESKTKKDSSGRAYVYQYATYITGNTEIYMASTGSLHWNQQQWGALLDSFQASKINDLSVRWQKPGP